MTAFVRLAPVLAAAALLAAAPARAQAIDYQQRIADMNALAGLFGELHHIRRLCEPRREANVWRDRMKRLIDLEQPTQGLQADLVRAFNDGYRGAQNRFDRCDSRAEDYAASRAAAGDAAVLRLMAPLYEAAGEAVFVSPAAVESAE